MCSQMEYYMKSRVCCSDIRGAHSHSLSLRILAGALEHEVADVRLDVAAVALGDESLAAPAGQTECNKRIRDSRHFSEHTDKYENNTKSDYL